MISNHAQYEATKKWLEHYQEELERLDKNEPYYPKQKKKKTYQEDPNIRKVSEEIAKYEQEKRKKDIAENKIYTDDAIILWGKYRYTALKRISAKWLLSFLKNKKLHDQKLVKYVEENYEKLKERVEAGDISYDVTIPCTKKIFLSEKEAKISLRTISALKNKDSHKIPVRTYECEKCGAWHLTSTPNKSNINKL